VRYSHKTPANLHMSEKPDAPLERDLVGGLEKGLKVI
jgi:hypothetical protein